MAIEACKAALVLAILERLFLTSNASWLEARARLRGAAAHRPCAYAHHSRFSNPQDHIDYVSLQALLIKRQGLGVVGQIRSFWSHTKRLCD